MSTFEGVRRMGPPVAVQKLREDFYMVQVPLSETPSADWKRLVLRHAAGAASRFSSARGGNERRIAEVPLRRRKCGDADGLD